MNNLAAEFREVFNLYIKLGEDLAKIMGVDVSKNPQAFVQSVLQNRETLECIAQMNSRVVQLSDSWGKCRNQLDPETRTEVQDLVAAARMQAIHLQELCSVWAQKLQRIHDELGTNLAEIGKGSQFLKSLKPLKNNYPKFVDSRY